MQMSACRRTSAAGLLMWRSCRSSAFGALPSLVSRPRGGLSLLHAHIKGEESHVTVPCQAPKASEMTFPYLFYKVNGADDA